jgi:diaminohydroxyphosphoribosylaminopyrimidine deaminase/5-amino-6-(5-phosphoribosylamino)uracil reductase
MNGTLESRLLTEREAMQRALTLALRGWGRVSPNPLVGAVLLRDGAVVGEGYHGEFGGPHAEVAALASCEDPRGCTCVVTLEPCSHVGKTRSCATALIEAEVSRVVAAVEDPNPEAAHGAHRLRDAGIEVEFGLESQAAVAQNAAFFHAILRPDRPFVCLKVATSLDGYLADVNRKSQWISGREAHEYVHWLRAGFDAIGVGRVTACEDDPALTVRGALVPMIPPRRVIFSRTGRLPTDLAVVKTAREIPTYLIAASTATSRDALAGSGVVTVCADSLEESLRALRRKGVRSLLVEGGGEIATAFLEQQLVDRLIWIQAPIWLHKGVSAFGSRSPVTLDMAERWNVIDQRLLGSDTLLVLDRELCLQG